ncbi:hypothetical protein AVEN_64298-1 [Araneus ventricosus]|uniref:Uncharacterized protein n=1 Tax=Araneus ventricosus TaxID=182803 RepID=A0A4Y2NBB2_ARAVE|nr:hypothetical protein AVEN_64298-1 [Araneus ventricosus]
MPLVHRLLYALRALADDEPLPSRRKHSKDKTPERNSSRHRQAAALVITFRDLFASGGLNFLLEDMEANRSSRKLKYNNSQCMDTSKNSLKGEYKAGSVTSSSQNKIEMCETLKVALESEHPLATSDSTNFLADPRDNTVALLHGDQIIASSGLSIFSGVESPSRLLVPINPESGALEVYGRKKHKNLTVPLSAEDENKTVDALRKVLKWSPRKQSLAKFSVPLPKEEEHKAVAVVQNAVNRVKEEQQQKRRRKFKLFKITFC